MNDLKSKNPAKCHYLMNDDNRISACSPNDMQTAAGLKKEKLFVTSQTIQHYGSTYSRKEAATKVREHAIKKFKGDPVIQTLRSCSESGMAVAPARIEDEKAQRDKVIDERNYYTILGRQTNHQLSPVSYINLIGCVLLVVAMFTGGYFEFQNARAMVMSLGLLNLGETYAEQLRNAGAMVLGLVALCPAIPKVREMFLSDYERQRFRRRVFGVGTLFVLLLILNWGWLSYLNQAEGNVLIFDESSVEDNNPLKYAMCSFYVLQLSTFGIAMYGLAIALQRCWIFAFPLVIDETSTQRGSNKVSRRKTARQIVWESVHQNCKSLQEMLDAMLEEVVLDAQVRVAAYQHHKRRKQIADEVLRDQIEKKQDYLPRSRKQSQPLNPESNGDNHAA